mmetsp:Transcript_11459/g.33788  ORF Transcript_11459/g.33788 Transcript_11459/m.33788 type:complete len:250 (-) Transcript_11459:231-980(-)
MVLSNNAITNAIISFLVIKNHAAAVGIDGLRRGFKERNDNAMLESVSSGGALLKTDAEATTPIKKTGEQDSTWEWEFPFPPFPRAVASGVTFSRNIIHINGGSKFHLTFGPEVGSTSHCKSADTFGDNNCHYKWGDGLVATYKLDLETELEDSDTIHGHFKIDRVVPWEFSCKVCGQDCTLKAPVIDEEWSFAMEPCPIQLQNATNSIFTKLRGDSPVDGITTHAQGNVQILKQGVSLLAEFSVDVFIK